MNILKLSDQLVTTDNNVNGNLAFQMKRNTVRSDRRFSKGYAASLFLARVRVGAPGF